MMLPTRMVLSGFFGVLAFSSILTSAFAPFGHIPNSFKIQSHLAVSSVHDEDATSSPQVELTSESASLLPGQVVSIRIGDMSNPRKAWKKRRRTGSPILVPCSILGMNRETMVKNNLINLLHRFGKPQEHDSHKGVVLSVGAAVKLYKHRLGGNLLEHANALGYDTIVKMIRALFDKNALKDSGVEVSRVGAKRELALCSSLSLRLARESAYMAEFVQFMPSDEDKDRMLHTGTTFRISKDDKYQTLSTPDVVQPLSAAVRISQADAEKGRFQAGMECNAFFTAYDGMGDNGSPLATCAIDPPRGQIRDQMKRRAYVKRQIDAKTDRKRDMMVDKNKPTRDLNELRAGDGPYTATVVKVSSRANAAFVDLGVSRQKGKKAGGGTTKVLAMLRFDDIVDGMPLDEIDEEAALIEASLLEGSDDDGIFTVEDLFEDEGEDTIEDVSDTYSMDEHGNVIMIDPDTGEKTILGSADEDEEENEDADDEESDDMFAGMGPEERLKAIGDMLEKEEKAPKEIKNVKTAKDIKLRHGDKVDVFVRAVFPQSGRFMVTQNSSIKDNKLKDLKREKQAEKRLSKLAKKMGGEDGLNKIVSSVGVEMEGMVKAKSKTGDWYYVQPADESFPVGLAKCEIAAVLDAGQSVKIRVDGIDEARGQLALTILSV